MIKTTFVKRCTVERESDLLGDHADGFGLGQSLTDDRPGGWAGGSQQGVVFTAKDGDFFRWPAIPGGMGRHFGMQAGRREEEIRPAAGR